MVTYSCCGTFPREKCTRNLMTACLLGRRVGLAIANKKASVAYWRWCMEGWSKISTQSRRKVQRMCRTLNNAMKYITWKTRILKRNAITVLNAYPDHILNPIIHFSFTFHFHFSFLEDWKKLSKTIERFPWTRNRLSTSTCSPKEKKCWLRNLSEIQAHQPHYYVQTNIANSTLRTRTFISQ